VLYDDELLARISQLGAVGWEGEVFRHMFADFPPDRENTVGARWNPPEVPAIYTSQTRAGALAEGEYQILMQPRRPKAKRTIYKIGLLLANVITITDPKILRAFGIERNELEGIDPGMCQRLGGAVERLGHDGLVVPSARSSALNLVVFPNRQVANRYRFEILDTEVIDIGDSW
jgi:RES domain-containing protein